MDRSPAAVWTFLLGAGLALASLHLQALTTSEADPRPPRLIGCVFLNRANVTCRWEAGDAQTAFYTLHVHLVFNLCRRPQSGSSPGFTAAPFLDQNRSAKEFTCNTSGTSCTASFDRMSVRNCFCTVVTAHGRNWSASSCPRCQSGRTEVMLPPVILNSIKAGGSPRCLIITWRRDLSSFPLSYSDIKAGHLKSQIEFTAEGQFDTQVETAIVRDYSFPVCPFRPDTSYTVRLRHHYLGPESPWSPWSNACQGRTGEDAPSAAPAFWRRVGQPDGNGWRRVSMLWKPLLRLLANGRVLFFNVTCQTESADVLDDHMSCRDLHHTRTSCSLLLPAGPCSCALTASTSAGTSPEARIWLSGASEPEPPPPSRITASPLNDSGLDVRWTPPADWPTSGFVVEWFAVREKTSSNLHWEKLNTSCTALVITEAVKPMECYAVSVKALHGERGAGQNATVYIYTRQGAPSAGPKVAVQQISGSRVELVWSPVPVELLHGFIRNYTIYYTTENQPARGVTLPSKALRCSLVLSPGNHDIFMQANTDAGAGASGPTSKVHIGSEEISIMMFIVLPLIVAPLVLMACMAQHKMMKLKMCRDVPDPSHSSLASWTPKISLECMKQHAVAERSEIKYSEVILLGEKELPNSDPYQELQTYPSYGYSPLPGSPNSSKSAQTTSEADLSPCTSIYSNILFSQTLTSPPTPLLSRSYLQPNDWQHRIVST